MPSIDIVDLDRVCACDFSPTGTYVHHDFHPGNIFFEESSDAATFIDFDMFVESVAGGTGEPIGVPAYDVIYFRLWLQIMGAQNGFPPKRITELITSFDTAYKIDEISSQERSFVTALMIVDYAIRLSDALVDPNHSYHQLGEENIRGILAILDENIQELKT